MIQLGDRGALVRVWQRIVGVGASKCDAKFGPGTEAAVKNWQARNGIEPDGVIGDLCRTKVDPAALVKAYEGCVLQAYDDSSGPLSARLLHRVGGAWFRADGAPCRGTPTIGWGSTGPCRQGIERCTQAQADRWLLDFLEQIALPAARKARPDASAAEMAALAGLAYNGGPGAVQKLVVAQFSPAWWLNNPVHPAGSPPGTRDAGLMMRRAEECALYWDAEPPSA